jgi:hypothetical protein
MEAPTQPPRPLNQVTLVGILDQRVLDGQAQTHVTRRNPLQGVSEQFVLQIPMPLGSTCALPVEIGRETAGYAVIAAARPGQRLRIDGSLIWEERDAPSRRSAADALRRSSDLTVQVSSVVAADEQLPIGSDVRLSGRVLGSPRFARHPQRPSLLLATTFLRITGELRSSANRAILEIEERVPIAVPVQHAGASALLRPGNLVAVDGMLERVTLPIRGADVDQAVGALDADWERCRQAIRDSEELERAERRYRQRRRWLSRVVRTRVLVGFVDLLEGAPAGVREAQRARRASLRRPVAAGGAPEPGA